MLEYEEEMRVLIKSCINSHLTDEEKLDVIMEQTGIPSKLNDFEDDLDTLSTQYSSLRSEHTALQITARNMMKAMSLCSGQVILATELYSIQ